MGWTTPNMVKGWPLWLLNVLVTYHLSTLIQVDIFTTALLHDIGVSCSQEHELLVTTLDWEKAQTHCLDGEVHMKSLPFYAPYADAIYYHHTHWQTLADKQQVSQDSKSLANLIFLVDRVDALLFQYLQQNPDDEAIHARNTIQQNIQSLPGYFAPELVEAFVTAPRPIGLGFQLLRQQPVRDRIYASLHWQEPTILRPVTS